MNLDRKITIQNQTKTKNGFGEDIVVWSTFAVVWASVNYKGGREGFYAKQVVAIGDVVFKIRYTSGITPAMRIDFEGTKYDITVVAESGRKDYMELTAKSHDNDSN